MTVTDKYSCPLQHPELLESPAGSLENLESGIPHPVKTSSASSALDSSRVKAVLKVISYSMNTWSGEKIIVFSNFLKFPDFIARVLKEYLGLSCLRFDGTIDKNEKHNVQESFKADERNILLITSGAGSVPLLSLAVL